MKGRKTELKSKNSPFHYHLLSLLQVLVSIVKIKLNYYPQKCKLNLRPNIICQCSQETNISSHIHHTAIQHKLTILIREQNFHLSFITMSFMGSGIAWILWGVRTDRTGQTVQTQIRLLPEEQSDQSALFAIPFDHFDKITY